jgi:hypothetical protein
MVLFRFIDFTFSCFLIFVYGGYLKEGMCKYIDMDSSLVVLIDVLFGKYSRERNEASYSNRMIWK